MYFLFIKRLNLSVILTLKAIRKSLIIARPYNKELIRSKALKPLSWSLKAINISFNSALSSFISILRKALEILTKAICYTYSNAFTFFLTLI